MESGLASQQPGDHGGATIELRDVGKSYVTPGGLRIDALVDLSLNVEAGERVAVMAPSGAGKSTLLHLLGAMDRPDAGSIVVDGVDIAGLPERRLPDYRRTVGFVFQRFHLLSALNALDNVMAPVMPYKPSAGMEDRARMLLDEVGLSDRLDALPAKLSGGQQQRVAIARALINQPRLLLADEPTGNLDSRTGAAVMELILDLVDRENMTLLVATHDQAVAARCNWRVELLDGRLVSTTPRLL